jgi:hypothetical protein
MSAKKRGKRPGLRARSKNARGSERVTKLKRNVVKRINSQQSIEALMNELFDTRHKLQLCRQIMEANDPGNAFNIFGPPLESTAQAEGESPQAKLAEAPAAELTELPEGQLAANDSGDDIYT